MSMPYFPLPPSNSETKTHIYPATAFMMYAVSTYKDLHIRQEVSIS